MRFPRWRAFAVLSWVAGLGLATACGSFGGSDSPPPDAGSTTDGGDVDPDASAGADASRDGASDGSVAPTPSCRRSKGPSNAPTASSRRLLYAANDGHPFSIATDDDYVYWVEQRPPGDSYNGNGVARILRTDRAPSSNASRATVLAADQPQATAMTRVGAYVYWAVFETPDGAPARTRIRRTLAHCSPPCSVDDVTGSTNFTGLRALRLYPAGGDALFLLFGPGHLFRFEPNGIALNLKTLGTYPAIAVMDDALYGSSMFTSSIFKASLDGTTKVDNFLAVPPVDGGQPGLSLMTTDCTTVFGFRNPGDVLWRMNPTGNLAQVGSSQGFGYFAVVADDAWVYGAMPNAGGLIAIDKTTGAATKVEEGNLFDLAVDDQGVYWGEHGGQSKITMLVK